MHERIRPLSDIAPLEDPVLVAALVGWTDARPMRRGRRYRDNGELFVHYLDVQAPTKHGRWGARERAIPMAAAAPYGYLNPHVRHRANMYGIYNFDFGRAGSLATSGILNYRTGRVWSRSAAVPLASVDEYQSTPGTYVHFFDGRGNNEFPSVWSLDLGLRYALPLIGSVAPFVKLAVENVLDNDQLIAFQTTGTRSAVNNSDGTFSHWEWVPTGNANPQAANYMPSCNPASGQFSPSKDCTGFGRIRTQTDYQIPREFLLSVGIQF